MGLCQSSATTQETASYLQTIQEPSYILPANEQNSEVDLLTGSKANIQTEQEDFAYIGSSDLIGFAEFQQIFDQLELKQDKYSDNKFPASTSSLLLPMGSTKYDWNQYNWKRPDQFFDRNFQLFLKSVNSFLNKRDSSNSGIEPDDIKQGQLGDCYFLASLSAIAEYPYRIKRIFVTKKSNAYGIYCVRLCHFGEWQTVFVDDQFPCNYSGPVFTRGNNNEIWVLVLEKAWAKLYGSYEKIEAGYTREALKSLTSAPTQNIWTNCSEQELWQTIQNADQEKFIMTCGTDNNSGDNTGLVSGHAYTLIGCAMHEGNKLVRLRNPWGSKEWKGNWSDNDRVWTQELQNILNHNPAANDGTFYMELSDFQNYFPVMQICYYNDNYHYTSLKIESNENHAQLIKMKVQQASDYYISIIQENERMYQPSDNYQYSNCKLLIAKVNYETKTYKWVAGKQLADQEFWINEYLTPGDYLIYVKTYWQDFKSRPFVLSSYGASTVAFQQTQKNLFPPTLLSDIMMTHPMQKLAHYPKIDGITKHFEMYQKEGFGIFWIKNESGNQFTTKIQMTKKDGLKLRKPFRGNIIEFFVKPNQQLIALVDVDPKSYILQYSEEYMS